MTEPSSDSAANTARGCLGVGAMWFFFASLLIGWVMMTFIPLLAGEPPIANIGFLVFWTAASLILWRLAGGKGWGFAPKENTSPDGDDPETSKWNEAEDKSRIPQDWSRALEKVGVDLADVERYLVGASYDSDVMPARSRVFRAFHATPFRSVRVVVLGQDPYPERGVADSLAFSAHPSSLIPRSLQRIFDALAADPQVSVNEPSDGNLKRWAKQGVLLLNCALSVQVGEPGSHLGRWRKFTLGVLRSLDGQGLPIVFLTFGDPARDLIAQAGLDGRHMVLSMAHPVAWATTELPKLTEARPFSKANSFLQENGRGHVEW